VARSDKERLSEEWRNFAACAGVDISVFYPNEANFFIEDEDGNAGKYCFHCPVQDECLNYAVTYEIRDGIFGGTNEAKRLKLINAKINLRRKESRERRKNKNL